MKLPVRFVLGAKNLYLFVLSSVVLLYGLYTYLEEALFYFHDPVPVNLGTAIEPNDAALAALSDGDYVTIRGIRSVQGGVIEEGFSKKKFMIYYLLGSPRFVAVEAMPEKKDGEEENLGGTVVTIRGRAYGFQTDPGAKRFSDFFEKNYGITMAEKGWLLRAGIEPRTDLFPVLLWALLLALFAANIALAVKTLRRSASVGEEGDDGEEYGPEDDGEET